MEKANKSPVTTKADSGMISFAQMLNRNVRDIPNNLHRNEILRLSGANGLAWHQAVGKMSRSEFTQHQIDRAETLVNFITQSSFWKEHGNVNEEVLTHFLEQIRNRILVAYNSLWHVVIGYSQTTLMGIDPEEREAFLQSCVDILWHVGNAPEK